MKTYLTSILIIISFLAHSQTKFQKGYFLKTNGDKVEYLIKNEDWSINSSQFSDKLFKNSKTLTAEICF